MKLQKAINIIKKSTSITLLRNDSGRRLLSNGAAAYDVSGFPEIETEGELAAVLGINKPKDHVFAITDIPEILNTNAETIYAEQLATSVCFGGEEVVLFDCGKIYAVHAEYLKPFEEDDLFHCTPLPDGGCVISAGGLITTGYIMPVSVSDDRMITDISEIAKRGIWRASK